MIKLVQRVWSTLCPCPTITRHITSTRHMSTRLIYNQLFNSLPPLGGSATVTFVLPSVTQWLPRITGWFTKATPASCQHTSVDRK